VAHDLWDVLDFDALFQGTLVAELQNAAPEYVLILKCCFNF
jgi:hypothetical protein